MLLENKKLGNDLHYIEIYRTQELTFLKENQGSVKSYFHHPLSIKKISLLRKKIKKSRREIWIAHPRAIGFSSNLIKKTCSKGLYGTYVITKYTISGGRN